jgi:hypothetical protein
MLDGDGLVNIWEFERKIWRKATPVDAKEIIATKSGSLAGPEDKPPPEPKPEPEAEPAKAKAEFPPEAVKSTPPDKPKKSGGK